MKFTKGFLLLLVFATVVLLGQGAQTAQDSKRDKKVKGKKRPQSDVAQTDVVQTDVADREESLIVNQGVESPVDVQIDEADIVPSVAHNGKLGKKQKKEQRKAEKKAERKAEMKALRKADKRKQRKEERSRHKQYNGMDKSTKKAMKKAARKAAKRQQQQEDAGTEIVSFDDIVEERHGDPIPNPLPPVEGTATESQSAAMAKLGNGQATDNKAERRHQKQLAKQEKKKKKKERRRHKEHVTCESNNDCEHGSCCVEKKGGKFCLHSRKDEGQKCADDCMCRAGLACISEEVAPGKEKGFCRVSETPELDTGNAIGAVEDAVENVMDNNQ